MMHGVTMRFKLSKLEKETTNLEMKVVQEYCWGITQEQGSRAVTEQVAVCWSLNFNWTPWHTHT